MFLPIVSYGSPVLRKKCENIDENYPQLDKLLENMWKTMYNSSGVGLAAPQINLPISLFIVDTKPFIEEGDEDNSIKKVFINAAIIKEEGDEWSFNEGCLSIPDIREEVKRKSVITIKYQDEDFKWHNETFKGIIARVIQHEYDHIQGKLSIDYVSPLRKRMLKRKLENISKGKVAVNYRMKFPR